MKNEILRKCCWEKKRTRSRNAGSFEISYQTPENRSKSKDFTVGTLGHAQNVNPRSEQKTKRVIAVVCIVLV